MKFHGTRAIIDDVLEALREIQEALAEGRPIDPLELQLLGADLGHLAVLVASAEVAAPPAPKTTVRRRKAKPGLRLVR